MDYGGWKKESEDKPEAAAPEGGDLEDESVDQPDTPAAQEKPDKFGLSTSNLHVEEDCLLYRMYNGTIATKIALVDIRSVKAKSTMDLSGIFFLLIGGGLVYLGLDFFEADWAKWTSCIFGAILALIGFFSLSKRILELQVKGETIRFPVTEEKAVVQGFAITLQDMIDKAERKY